MLSWPCVSTTPPSRSTADDEEILDYLTHGLDTALVDQPSLGVILAGDFNKLDHNKMAINSKKTKDMWVNYSQTSKPPLLQIASTSIERVNHLKLLQFGSKMTLNGMHMLRTLPKNLQTRYSTYENAKKRDYLKRLASASITAMLEYGAPIRGGIPSYLKDEVECIQKGCLKLIGLPPDSLPSLKSRRNKARYY